MQATYNGSGFQLSPFFSWRREIWKNGGLIFDETPTFFGSDFSGGESWYENLKCRATVGDQVFAIVLTQERQQSTSVNFQLLLRHWKGTVSQTSEYLRCDKTNFETFTFSNRTDFTAHSFSINGVECGQVATPSDTPSALPLVVVSDYTLPADSQGDVYRFRNTYTFTDPRFTRWGSSCYDVDDMAPVRDGKALGWCNYRNKKDGTINNGTTAKCTAVEECKCDNGGLLHGYENDAFFRRDAEGGDICQCCYHPTTQRITQAAIQANFDTTDGVYAAGPFSGRPAMMTVLDTPTVFNVTYPGQRLMCIPGGEYLPPQSFYSGSVATSERTIWRLWGSCAQGWLPEYELDQTQCSRYYYRRTDISMYLPVWLSPTSYEDSAFFGTGDYAGWLDAEKAAARIAECADPAWLSRGLYIGGADWFDWTAGIMADRGERYPQPAGGNAVAAWPRFGWEIATAAGSVVVAGSQNVVFTFDANECQAFPNPLP